MNQRRCRVCRRPLPVNARLDRCEAMLECAFVEDAWRWNPCPIGRCQFPGVDHRREEPETGPPTVTCPDGWITELVTS